MFLFVHEISIRKLMIFCFTSPNLNNKSHFIIIRFICILKKYYNDMMNRNKLFEFKDNNRILSISWSHSNDL